jgi:Flp pilus assembly pilin Flp
MRATIERFEALHRPGLDRTGSTAIEYGLISIVIAVLVFQIGDTMETLFYDKFAGMF